MEFNKMMFEAGIMRSECFVTSLLRVRVPGNDAMSQFALKKADLTPGHIAINDKMVTPIFREHLDFLEREIDLVKPRIILVLGNAPLFALTGKWGIKSWRGSILPYSTRSGHDCFVIGTYPPDYVQSVWKERPVCVADMRRCKSILDGKTSGRAPEYNFLIRPSLGTTVSVLDDLLRKVANSPTRLSVDIETRGGHIACTGIAWSKTDAICIPQMVSSLLSGTNNYWASDAEESLVTWKLYKLLTHPNAEIIGQNFLYDAQYFWRHFHFIPNFKRDTMIAHHSMFSNMPKGLDFLSSMYAEHHLYWKDESKNWDPKMGEEQLWVYNCKDAVITYEIDEVEQLAIDSVGLREPSDFQQSLFHPVLKTMNDGIRLADRGKICSDLMSEISSRESWLESVLGRTINIKSPKQMADLFYRELAQKPNFGKSGGLTCDDAALERIGVREPLLLPLLKVIAELRSLGVFLSTFAEAPADADGRMRCSFNIAGTETYRFSSSENAFGSGMNLQNIPKGEGDEDSDLRLPNMRKPFIPDPGYTFFDIDLDSADLRIVTAESECVGMQEMLDAGKKPYVEVAREYYQDSSITKESPSYKLFKALSHATNYLGTPKGIADRVNQYARQYNIRSLSAEDIKGIQTWYFGKFPEIRRWHDRLISQVNTTKTVRNVFGYRMHFLDRIEGNIYNRAVAWIPQSTVGCLINRGYRNIYERLPYVQVLLQVHDSLAGQFPTHMGDLALREIVDACSIELPYRQPIMIPVGIKSSPVSWGDC